MSVSDEPRLPERRAESPEMVGLREGLRTLNERSAEISEQVLGLAKALNTVGVMQEKQLEIEATARTAATRVEQVDAASHRRAFRLSTLIAVLAAVFLVYSITIVVVIAVYAHNTAGIRNASRQLNYSNCLVRNQQLVASRAFLDSFITIESQSQDQATAQRLIALLNKAESGQKPESCPRFLHP